MKNIHIFFFHTNFNHLPQHFVGLHCLPKAMNLIFDQNQLVLPPLFTVQNIKRKRTFPSFIYIYISFFLFVFFFSSHSSLNFSFCPTDSIVCVCQRAVYEMCCVSCKISKRYEQKKVRCSQCGSNFVPNTYAWKRCVSLQNDCVAGIKNSFDVYILSAKRTHHLASQTIFAKQFSAFNFKDR